MIRYPPIVRRSARPPRPRRDDSTVNNVSSTSEMGKPVTMSCPARRVSPSRGSAQARRDRRVTAFRWPPCASCCAAAGADRPGRRGGVAPAPPWCRRIARRRAAASPGASRKAGPGPGVGTDDASGYPGGPGPAAAVAARFDQPPSGGRSHPAGRRAGAPRTVAAQLGAHPIPTQPTRAAPSATQQPGPQRPRPRRRRRGRAAAQRAGLRTYPAPRRVWIIGVAPVSIFLRRYETYSSTMLDRRRSRNSTPGRGSAPCSRPAWNCAS